MILKQLSTKKSVLIFGLIFFAIHLLYSWVYFKERMLNEDGSYYLTQLIREQRFLCEHYRYSVFLFQWIPLFALKAGASIEFVTKMYSVSFEVFYLLLFLCCLYLLKNIKGALMIVFFLCVVLGRDYFLPIGEYQSSIIASLALCGLTFCDSNSIDWKKIVAAVIIVLISLNFHTLGFLSLFYIISYEFLESEKKYRKYWVLILLITVVIYAIRSALLPFDQYEHDKMKGFENIFEYIFHPSRLLSVSGTLQHFVVFLPELILLFFISMAILIVQKRWLTLVFSLLYSYFVLILFSVLRGDVGKIFWNAEYFLLLGLPALMPLVTYLFLQGKGRIVFYLILACFIFIFVFRIESNLGYFQNKIKYAERLIYNGSFLPEKRYIIDRRVEPMFISNTWPITFQTLILSSFNNPNAAVSYIFADDINMYDSLIKNKSVFLGPEWSIEAFGSKINKEHYFHLPSNGYRKLTTSQQNFIADTSSFNASTISIFIKNNKAIKINDSLSAIYIYIANNSGQVIPSIPASSHPTFLSYHVVDTFGKSILFDNMRTTLETDIYRQAELMVYIKTNPFEEKLLDIQVDFVTEGIRWWGINAKATIEIE